MKTGNDLVAEQVRYSTCFAIYPTAQTNTILLLYNELQFFCRIPLLVVLIVFYRFTGLAFADISTLSKEFIVEDDNGEKWIRKPRQKTGEISTIPLLDIPQRLIKKYENHPTVIAKGLFCR